MKRQVNKQSKTEIVRKRENELLKKLDDLKHICFGMYAKIIPENLSTWSEEGVKTIVQRVAEQLATESVSACSSEGEYQFYRAFYQTSIYYLLGQCNEEDQILLSLRKLASTFDSSEFTQIEKTTFSFLLDNVRNIRADRLNEQERIYAVNCLESYKEFEIYYEQQMDPAKFSEIVSKGVNNFADKQARSCIISDKVFEEVLRIIGDACNEAYFTVYQRWEE